MIFLDEILSTFDIKVSCQHHFVILIVYFVDIFMLVYLLEKKMVINLNVTETIFL